MTSRGTRWRSCEALAGAQGRRAELLAKIATDAEQAGDEFTAELGWSPVTARNRLFQAQQNA